MFLRRNPMSKHFLVNEGKLKQCPRFHPPRLHLIKLNFRPGESYFEEVEPEGVDFDVS